MPTYTPAELVTLINSSLPSSGSSSITAADLRTVLNAMVNSQQLTFRIHTAAGAVTVVAKDDIVEVNQTTGNEAKTVNLPSDYILGKPYYIKDGKGIASTYNLTLTPAAGTIEGGASLLIKTGYGLAGVYHDGTEWKQLR